MADIRVVFTLHCCSILTHAIPVLEPPPPSTFCLLSEPAHLAGCRCCVRAFGDPPTAPSPPCPRGLRRPAPPPPTPRRRRRCCWRHTPTAFATGGCSNGIWVGNFGPVSGRRAVGGDVVTQEAIHGLRTVLRSQYIALSQLRRREGAAECALCGRQRRCSSRLYERGD